MIKVPATEFYKMTQKKQNNAETMLKEELKRIFPKVEETTPKDDFVRDAQFTVALDVEIHRIYEYYREHSICGQNRGVDKAVWL